MAMFNAAILPQKTCFILDLDGVVYRGEEAIEGAPATIQLLRGLGKKVVFLTNNSASSSEKVVAKLCRLGIPCCGDDLLTSAQAARIVIQEKQLDANHGVFVVGTDALRCELEQHSITCVDPASCGAVLVGLDPNFDYITMTQALEALKRPIPLIACNRDANYPGQDGHLFPGCGAMVGALEACSGRKADFEVGKPNTMMLDIVLHRLQVAPEECIVVGDSLEADIAMANRAQVMSILIGDNFQVAQAMHSAKPDIWMHDLRDLQAYFLGS
jgi:HAD superfamily hydrolase (TIGR01450 family)